MISLGLADKCDGSDDLSFQIWSVPKLGKFVRWTQGHKHFSQFDFNFFFPESDLNSESKKNHEIANLQNNLQEHICSFRFKKFHESEESPKRNLLGLYLNSDSKNTGSQFAILGIWKRHHQQHYRTYSLIACKFLACIPMQQFHTLNKEM